MTPLEHAMSEALLHFIWQGIAVGILLWIALYFLRRSSSNARYTASCMALALQTIAIPVTVWIVYSPQHAMATGNGFGFAVAPVGLPASWFHTVETWALPLWAFGVLLFSVRLIGSWSHTRKLRRAGEEADSTIVAMVSRVADRLGVGREIRVLMSSIAEMPSVVGWIRPVLLLPASAIVGLTPQQLEAVIAHELAHIRRLDYLVNIFQTIVETLLFYHPIVWWTSSQIRYERELCCDDLAVKLSGDAVAYARALTKLEKDRVLKPSLAMGSLNGSLLQRVRRLLGEETGEHNPPRVLCGIAVLAGIVCLAVSLSWAQDRGNQSVPSPASVQQAEDASKDVNLKKLLAEETAKQEVVVQQAAAAMLQQSQSQRDIEEVQKKFAEAQAQKDEASRNPDAEKTSEFMKSEMSRLQQTLVEMHKLLEEFQLKKSDSSFVELENLQRDMEAKRFQEEVAKKLMDDLKRRQLGDLIDQQGTIDKLLQTDSLSAAGRTELERLLDAVKRQQVEAQRSREALERLLQEIDSRKALPGK